MTEKKIALIVIDRMNLRQRVANACTEGGLRVLSAHNALSALQIAGDYDIDILVTDFEMYRMNGVELSQEIRELSSDRKVFCIVVCSADRKSNITEVYSNVPDLFLIKPVTDDDITKSIEKALQVES